MKIALASVLRLANLDKALWRKIDLKMLQTFEERKPNDSILKVFEKGLENCPGFCFQIGQFR